MDGVGVRAEVGVIPVRQQADHRQAGDGRRPAGCIRPIARGRLGADQVIHAFEVHAVHLFGQNLGRAGES